MAEADKNEGNPEAQPSSRQPVSYPSPVAQPSYAYPQENDGAEPYRAAQDGNSISLPPLNLPPIRTIEGPNAYLQQAGQPSPYARQPMHAAPPSQYIGYPQTGSATAQHLAAGGTGPRQKKEIKRRTKTGCLTCRKRRIKCDETHPSCRNCQKSKRECLGYDPVFRQQQPLPLLGQSALNQGGFTAQAPRTSTASTTPAASYSPLPQSYAPAPIEATYHQDLVNALQPPVPSIGPQYDYNSAVIDPALGSSEQVAMASHTPYDPVQDLQPNVEPAYSRESAYTSPAPTAGSATSKARRIVTVEALYIIGGADPPTPTIAKPITADQYKEIEYMCTHEYAKGIDQVLETTWFSAHGVARVLEDERLCEMFAGMLNLFASTKGNNYEGMRMLPSTESRMIWSIMELPRKLSSAKAQTTTAESPVPDDDELHDVSSRLAIFEKLITGQIMKTNPLGSQPTPTPLGYKGRQKKFWHLLGQFVSIPASEGLQVAESILSQLRQLLDEIENRDVLYSMAIVRHIGAQVVDFPGIVDGPYHGPGNAAEEKTKLRVAKKFIEDEAAGKGTTQAIQRLCGMAVRSWAMQ